MCNQDAIQPLVMHAGMPEFQAPPPAGLPFQRATPFASSVAFGAASGSRRRRLWELSHHCHCPVVGVCLPLGTLRTVVNKVLGGQALADNYEIHVGAVAECGCKNKLSVALQKVLEQRYAFDIMRFKPAKTAREVAQLWTLAIEEGDIAGAFWAALTHPRCDAILQEVVCRDMHMLQHQAGATVRTDLAKFKTVMAENAVLARELGRVQERVTLQMAEKTGEIEKLKSRLIRLQAESISKDSEIAFLTADMAHMSLAAADLVICQTGCISHNAYWRVKDFCKRTGKQCVFVENPSASSLARGLEQFSASVVQADEVLTAVLETSSSSLSS